MAIEKKSDCVILGLLSHEDLTGYEIKKRMDTALKYFWGASYGSIYPALGDLVKRGLASKRDGTENNRNKIIYSIISKLHCLFNSCYRKTIYLILYCLCNRTRSMSICISLNNSHYFGIVSDSFSCLFYIAIYRIQMDYRIRSCKFFHHNQLPLLVLRTLLMQSTTSVAITECSPISYAASSPAIP